MSYKRNKIIVVGILFAFIFVLSNDVFAAQKHEADFDDLSEYYSTQMACKNIDEDCVNRPEYKFYLKMYDIYYLYKNKYKVNLDLPLIMATLFYNSDQMSDVVEMNLNEYDHEDLVKTDWNPKNTTTLDWEYKYETLPNYLVYNDSSFDMQILAKNMVTKTTEQSCVDKDGLKTKTEKVKDTEEDLKCGEGEKLEKGSSTYKLDYDKYDDFLLKYIEYKYYLRRMVDESCIPGKTNSKALSSGNDENFNSSSNCSSSNSGAFMQGDIIYYNQGDYSAYSYGGFGTIQSHGCGPSSLSIVISSMTGEEHDPVEITNHVCGIGGCTDAGTTLAAIGQTIEDYGFHYTQTTNINEVYDALSNGDALVIASMGPGHFTTGGHYITLTGASAGNMVTIYDPGNRSNNHEWDMNLVGAESNYGFWIVTR